MLLPTSSRSFPDEEKGLKLSFKLTGWGGSCYLVCNDREEVGTAYLYALRTKVIRGSRRRTPGQLRNYWRIWGSFFEKVEFFMH